MEWILRAINIREIPRPAVRNNGSISSGLKVSSKCPNDAPDSTFPFCCQNGAVNRFCCLGPYVNPTCSEPTCPNGAPLSTYPYCCTNGAKTTDCRGPVEVPIPVRTPIVSKEERNAAIAAAQKIINVLRAVRYTCKAG